MNALMVFLGGGLGAVIRYIISRLTFKPYSGFPLATLIANVIACLLLAFIIAQVENLPDKAKLLLATGLCGGLSTFSTFSLECYDLIENGQLGMAILYVLLSVILCLLVFGAVFFMTSK